MAEMKVSEMIEAEQVNDEDLIMIVQNGVNKKVPASKVGTGQAGGDTLPIGSILQCSVNDIPKNWLLCDGSEVNRVKYADLFNKIGTTYGEGDGSTTFNLPNLKGKVTVGKDEEDTDFDTLGKTGGEKKHKLTVDEMPSHSHTTEDYFEGGGGTPGVWAVRTVANLEGYRHGSYATGGDNPHNNLQPYTVINYIIKALQSSSSATTAEVLPVGSEIEFDGDAEEIPVGWEEVDDPHTYSTDEKVIGKWIDGKTLYRKTYRGTMVDASSEAKNIINIDVDYSEIWIDLQNSFITSQNESLTLNYYFAPTDYSRAYIKKDQKSVRIKTGVDLSGRNYFITLKYTKNN